MDEDVGDSSVAKREGVTGTVGTRHVHRAAGVVNRRLSPGSVSSSITSRLSRGPHSNERRAAEDHQKRLVQTLYS